MGERYPTVLKAARRTRERFMHDERLQERFPGLGQWITEPGEPNNSNTHITLIRTRFDPRPFMQAIRTESVGGTVEALERVIRSGGY